MRMSLTAALLVGSAALACANDAFEPPTLITSEGKPIQVEAPGYAVPCLTDLDGDGVRDLLVGQFKKVGLKGTDGKLLMVHHAFQDRQRQLTESICTKPFACDWDGDGDLDLVVGNFKGTFFLFRGQGQGAFEPTPTPLTTADGTALKATGVHITPPE